ncbi:hypothetical protein GWK47_034818 [Chionoecetes opilio]|uniref:Uncharacterized protein n=1 Tax=Chionoecetes opilio TaxID=41210 RepID=A0A8J4YIM9_CHIOP|nr:hypothetical protein GWK47_034818 [Chionoecetes opilio]
MEEDKEEWGKKEEDEVKVLGVTYDCRLTFKAHIEQLARESSGKLASLRRMSWLLDSKVLEVLYMAQVRSSMEYACLGWGGAANKHLALLDKVQGRAVRLIRDSGAGQEPQLHILQHRRDVAGLTVMYKVHQQRVPHLHTLRHPLRRAQVTTRVVALAPAELLQPRCRTWHHQRQFVCVCVGWWNALLASQPHHGGTTVQEFKELVNAWLPRADQHLTSTDRHRQLPVRILGENILLVHAGYGAVLSVSVLDSVNMVPLQTSTNRVSALRRVARFLDRGGKLLLYKAQIRPYLEYAALSWMSCAASHTRRLDSIQRRALRLVDAADPPDHPDPPALFEPVSPLDSLEHRRDVAALVVLHKAQVQGVPHLAGLRQPPRVATRSTRTVLTSGDAVVVPRSRASQHQRTFVGRVSRMWNIFTAAVPHIQEMNTQSVKLAANRWRLLKPTPLRLVIL